MDTTRKEQLRREVRRRRAAVPAAARRQAASAAAGHLLALAEIASAATVALYAAHGDELDPAPAVASLRARGVTTVLPRVDGLSLLLVPVASGTRLSPGYRGVPEPAGEALPPERLDLVVVPGVAFDLSGGRLGQGGGHFDRLLAALPQQVVRVGYAFACQVVEEVPGSPHDEPVDIVITEDGPIRTARRS